MPAKDFIDIPKLHFNFSDLLVDFFGCLIPGFVYIMFLFLIFFAPAAISHSLSPFALPVAGAALERFMPLFITFLFLLSYIFGHFFYRLDPKKPDKESYWFVRDQLMNTGPFREFYNHKKQCFCVECDQGKKGECEDYQYCDRIHLKKSELVKMRNLYSYKRKLNVEYPYDHLSAYLKERGFSELIQLIPWNAQNHSKRSKHFINSLKIRISINSPNNYSAIARNEAHIRLMSSVWYMMKTLQKACVLSAFLIALIISVKQNSLGILSGLASKDAYAFLLVSPGLFWIAFWYMVRKVKQFYHYQRIREIVFVLETAYFLHSTGVNIFLDGEMSFADA
ncbi:MAG: hypothetical protein JXB03_02115 [Spirochaetales bacterium]|nr:hypothetical protein [Spirochaetales bacterium]